MARSAIPVNSAPSTGAGVTLTGLVAAPADDHTVANDQHTILIFTNCSAGAVTATIVSVTDENGRTGDKTITVPAKSTDFDGVVAAGPFKASGYNQTGGVINIDTAALATELKIHAVSFARI